MGEKQTSDIHQEERAGEHDRIALRPREQEPRDIWTVHTRSHRPERVHITGRVRALSSKRVEQRGLSTIRQVHRI